MSSIRVTAPVLVAGKKGRIVFSVVPSKHLPLLIDRDFLTPARAVVDMGEKTLRIGTGVDNLVARDWHREANLIRRYPSASPCMTEETGPSDRRTALINRDSFDQFTSAWCGPCSTSLPSRRRCVLLERQRKSKARVGLHTGMVLQRSLVCNTNRCGWHVEQRQKNAAKVTFDTQRHQNSCHLVRCFMLFVHRRCHLVVICKLQRICSWISISLRRNAHVTRPAAVNSLISPSRMSFVQRAQNVCVPLQRTPEQPVPAPETPFQPVPHGNVAPVTPPLFRSNEAMSSTPPFQCETAPVTPRVENSKFAESASPFSVPVPHPMPNTSAVPPTLPADPVVAHAHVPTQIDESDRESAVDTRSDDLFQFDDPPVIAPVILPQPNP